MLGAFLPSVSICPPPQATRPLPGQVLTGCGPFSLAQPARGPKSQCSLNAPLSWDRPPLPWASSEGHLPWAGPNHSHSPHGATAAITCSLLVPPHPEGSFTENQFEWTSAPPLSAGPLGSIWKGQPCHPEAGSPEDKGGEPGSGVQPWVSPGGLLFVQLLSGALLLLLRAGRPWPSGGLPHTSRRSSQVDPCEEGGGSEGPAGRASLGLLPVVPWGLHPHSPVSQRSQALALGTGLPWLLLILLTGLRVRLSVRPAVPHGWVYPQAGVDPRSSVSPPGCSEDPEAGLGERAGVASSCSAWRAVTTFF